MDAEQIKTLLDMRMAKYPDHACLMQELTFKDEKIAALEAENARLLDVLASRSKYSIEPTTQVSADSFLLAQNAKLRKALSECMEAISDLGEIVGEVENACNNWHDHGHRGSRMGMFRIGHAVENPKAGVAIVKAVVVEKKAREVLGDDPITPRR